jgi:hypothetical protein
MLRHSQMSAFQVAIGGKADMPRKPGNVRFGSSEIGFSPYQINRLSRYDTAS